MTSFLTNLLPRLKQFSASLDKQELFVNKPWALIDENLNQQKYIFRRNGELIMSLNGKVLLGSWEYLVEAKCLLLYRVSDKLLLNHNFLDQAIMILKVDGLDNENLILANELLIPDLDVANYLQKLLSEKTREEQGFNVKNKIEFLELENGEEIEVVFANSLQLKGSKVLIKGLALKDGRIRIPSKGVFYVKDGEIISSITFCHYFVKQGKLIIETDKASLGFSINDYVFLNGSSAPDGKYKLGFLSYITVENGKVKGTSFF